MSLLHKDTRLALEAARGVGFAPALGPVTHQAFELAMRSGLANLDDAVLYRLFRAPE